MVYKLLFRKFCKYKKETCKRKSPSEPFLLTALQALRSRDSIRTVHSLSVVSRDASEAAWAVASYPVKNMACAASVALALVADYSVAAASTLAILAASAGAAASVRAPASPASATVIALAAATANPAMANPAKAASANPAMAASTNPAMAASVPHTLQSFLALHSAQALLEAL